MMKQRRTQGLWALGLVGITTTMLLTACSDTPDKPEDVRDRHVYIERAMDVPVGMVEKRGVGYGGYETTASEELARLDAQNVYDVEPSECGELPYLDSLVSHSTDADSTDRIAFVAYLAYVPWEFYATVFAREFSSSEAAEEFVDEYLDTLSRCEDGWQFSKEGEPAWETGPVTVEWVPYNGADDAWFLTWTDVAIYTEGAPDPDQPPVIIGGLVRAEDIVVILHAPVETTDGDEMSLMRSLILDYAYYLGA